MILPRHYNTNCNIERVLCAEKNKKETKQKAERENRKAVLQKTEVRNWIWKPFLMDMCVTKFLLERKRIWYNHNSYKFNGKFKTCKTGLPRKRVI